MVAERPETEATGTEQAAPEPIPAVAGEPAQSPTPEESDEASEPDAVEQPLAQA